MRAAILLWVTAWLAGCGGAPAGTRQAPPLPAGAVVLEGPSPRWEPSAAEVVGHQLWVANDKDRTLSAFQLPLAQGVNRPVGAPVKLPFAHVKIEALAGRAGAKGLWAWEVIGGQLIECDDVARCAAASPSEPAVLGAAQALARGEGRQFKYVTVEGMARWGQRLLFGVRQYRLASDDAGVAWSVVLDQDGQPVGFGPPRPLVLDGQAHGISSLAVDGDALWILWSRERPAAARAAVSGWLTRAPLTDAGLGPLTRCRAIPEGKPEGLAVYGEQLIVVFDNDGDRKDPGDPAKFRLHQSQDFALVIDKPACDGGPAF